MNKIFPHIDVFSIEEIYAFLLNEANNKEEYKKIKQDMINIGLDPNLVEHLPKFERRQNE